MLHWDEMLKNYYNLMGWDTNTGIPLTETLKALQLDFVIQHLYSQ
jgi:aldehyde:ferredoxin oxidoreductase